MALGCAWVMVIPPLVGDPYCSEWSLVLANLIPGNSWVGDYSIPQPLGSCHSSCDQGTSKDESTGQSEAAARYH